MKTRYVFIVAVLFGWGSLLLALASCGSSKKLAKVQETPQPTVVPEKESQKVEPLQAEESERVERAVRKEPLFQDINFDFDKYQLRPEARAILAQHAKTLQANPNLEVVIEGHCDEWGTVEYNLALGERRAKAAKDYLVAYGIDANRLTTISYGKERPLDPRHNKAAWAKNRRAAFVVVRENPNTAAQ